MVLTNGFRFPPFCGHPIYGRPARFEPYTPREKNKHRAGVFY